MNIRKEDIITNLSSRRLWQIVNKEQSKSPHSIIIIAARKELKQRKQYAEHDQFNCPH